MDPKTKKTAGELSLKARSDSSKIDPLEVAHALTDDITQQLQICAKRGEKQLDEEEFCLVLVVAGDPLIAGVRRHKYFFYPYLPKPRPQQAVFLYNKSNQSIRRLWSLPDAKVMSIISTMGYVDEKWKTTKLWSEAFFNDNFFEVIRKQHNIKMESEAEYLNAHREELIQAGCQDSTPLASEAFDFTKVMTN